MVTIADGNAVRRPGHDRAGAFFCHTPILHNRLFGTSVCNLNFRKSDWRRARRESQVGWEKRRFNRVPVSLTAVLNPVDIELNPLQPLQNIEAKLLDLSPTGMFAMTKNCYRTGTRFRVVITLGEESVEVFAIVRHAVPKGPEGQFKWGHGLQTIGATHAAVMTLVKYLETVVKQQSGAEPTKRNVLLPPAA